MSDSTSYDRDEGLARLAEEIAAGTPADPALLAARYGLEEADVRRCIAALDALRASFEEDLPSPEEVGLPALPPEYEMLGELGRGGMGIVYRVRQRSLDRTVALKLLRPGEEIFAEAVRRFEKEARALARLRHRHIVAIHEVGRTGGNLYYTMDLIEGASLAELIRDGQVPPTRAVRLLRQVAAAVAHAHAHGLIHRDLKPANILVDRAGDAFVVDFGLARDLGLAADATASGWIVGTPAYMSPEQAQGDAARIGEATDVYALGAVLYECLTGRPPFAGPSLAELIHAVVHDEPARPRAIAPGVPRDLEVICLKAMAKDPQRRYATVRALLEDLERFEEGKTIRARPPSWGYRLSRFARRRASTLLTALFTAVFVSGAVVLFRPAGTSTAQTAASLHAAGEHGAARLLLERELEATPGLLPAWADCTLETLRELARAGRWKEARDLCERVLKREKLPYRADFLWERARAVQRTGTAQEARKAFDNVKEALEQAVKERDGRWLYPSEREVGTVGLLERMLPELSDSADPGHPTATAFLAEVLMDPFVDTHVRRWMEGLGERVVPLIPAVLAALDVDEERRLDFGQQSLSGLVAAWSGPELELALASAAERPGVSPKGRTLLLSFLAASADLPIHLRHPFYTHDTDSEPDAAAKVVPMWKEHRELPRAERLARGIRHAVAALAGQGNRSWLSTWLSQRTGHDARDPGGWKAWEEVEGGSDPRLRLARALGVDPSASAAEVLQLYLRAEEGRRLRFHHLLRLLVPDVRRVPSLGIEQYEPRPLPMAWQRILHPDGGPATHLLRTCQLRLRDGNPDPLVAWNEVRAVRVGEEVEFDREIPVRPGPPMAWVGFTIPGLGSGRSSATVPSFQRVRGSARLEWSVEGLQVRWNGQESLRVIGGSTLRTGGGGDLVPALFVSSPDAAGGGSSSTGGMHHFEDVLTLGVAEPIGDPRPWTLPKWRERMKRDLGEIAGVLEADVPLPPRERRGRYKVHGALWKLLRTAWKLPMPESREELTRIGTALERTDGQEDSLTKSAYVARFHAGDSAVLDRAAAVASLTGDERELRPDFWSRAALAAEDVGVRDFALGQLKGADFQGRAEVTLDEAIRGGRLAAPEWLAKQVRGAEARQAREHRWMLLERMAVYLALAAGLVLAGLVYLVRAVRGAPLRAAPGLLCVGLAFAAFYVRVDGRDWLADGAGYALAALGAGLAARRGVGVLAWCSPAALALAGATDLAGWPALSGILAAVGIVTLPLVASALGWKPGLLGRILRSGFLVFYGGAMALTYGWMLAGILAGKDNAFRFEGPTAAAAVAVLSACLLWAGLHFRAAVRRKLQASA